MSASTVIDRVREETRRLSELADLARREAWPIVEVDGKFYRVNPEVLRFGSKRVPMRLDEHGW